MMCPKCSAPMTVGLDDIEVCAVCAWYRDDESEHISREWSRDEHGWYSEEVRDVKPRA